MTSIDLPERPRILVVTLRRLGDVLLTTPLVRTIRRGFPQARLEVLVFRGSERILKGNPDIDNVITIPGGRRPGNVRFGSPPVAALRSGCGHAGRRPAYLLAVVAGRRRVG